jgi:hypothetical protein
MRLPRALVFASFAGTLAAQTVHTVGPGGFATIQAAINAAANGDVVVIQSGSYAAFTLAKDLTLTAAPGATVDVAPATIFGLNVTMLQPPTSARLAGMRFRTVQFPVTLCQTQVLGGTVHFADCAFESSNNQLIPTAALLVQNARLAMQRCVVIGGGLAAIGQGSSSGCDGMTIANAEIAAVDCLFFGGNLNWDFTGRGGHGVLVDNSDVQFANCFASGGDNAAWNPAWPPGDGVHVSSTSRVWIADSELRGGNGHTNAGGSGLANLGFIAALQARSTFVGGAGAPPGAPVVGPLANAPLLGLDGATPAITLGSTWPVRYRAAPSTPVLVLWSDQLAASTQSLVSEPVWLPAANFAVAGAGVTDANGVAAFAFAVPSATSLLHATCFVQAFAGLAQPLEAAPPVGGTIR